MVSYRYDVMGCDVILFLDMWSNPMSVVLYFPYSPIVRVYPYIAHMHIELLKMGQGDLNTSDTELPRCFQGHGQVSILADTLSLTPFMNRRHGCSR